MTRINLATTYKTYRLKYDGSLDDFLTNISSLRIIFVKLDDGSYLNLNEVYQISEDK